MPLIVTQGICARKASVGLEFSFMLGRSIILRRSSILGHPWRLEQAKTVDASETVGAHLSHT